MRELHAAAMSGLVALSGIAGLLALPPPKPDLLPGKAGAGEDRSLGRRSERRVGRAREVLRTFGGALVAQVRSYPPSPHDSAALALDDSEESAWIGDPNASDWQWEVRLRRPVHLGLLRAHFGRGPAVGVPSSAHWEARPPLPGATDCARTGDYVPVHGGGSATIAGAEDPPPRRSWFVDVDACALRLTIDRTNRGPPVIREVFAYDAARDALLGAHASDGQSGSEAQGAIDGTYERYWAGQPGARHWVLTVTLPEPLPVDRVRLVFGWDAVSSPRGRLGNRSGRNYGIAYAPLRYALEASPDGATFVRVATTPLAEHGSTLPLRRRLIVLEKPEPLRVLRLLMDEATGPLGVPDPGAMPVVREVAAYRADDPRPVIVAPWLLSINANPTAQMHHLPGGEQANDAYFAGLVQRRFAALLSALDEDDFYGRVLGPRDELVPAVKYPAAGQSLESIEADDPSLDERLLAGSSPPPITILSGSNRWDYPTGIVEGRAVGSGWPWDPLRDAEQGGLGRLGPAVRHRAAPFLGFCGGAQLLALLEAQSSPGASAEVDQTTIDAVLRRNSGRPLKQPAPHQSDLLTAWPGDGRPRVAVTYNPYDPLFEDLAGGPVRDTTREFAERHEDVVRPDAFLFGRPLQGFLLAATSKFCGPDVVAGGPSDPSIVDPGGLGRCITVPEVFRSREGPYPVIGTQFHPEQSDYRYPAAGDPPESLGDPVLFLTAAFEHIVDAYLANAR